MAGLFHRNQAGLDNGPSAGPRLAVNNKENKVGIHFLSLRVGGPPTHTRPGRVVFRSRDTPMETGSAGPATAPPSGTHEEPAAAPVVRARCS